MNISLLMALCGAAIGIVVAKTLGNTWFISIPVGILVGAPIGWIGADIQGFVQGFKSAVSSVQAGLRMKKQKPQWTPLEQSAKKAVAQGLLVFCSSLGVWAIILRFGGDYLVTNELPALEAVVEKVAYVVVLCAAYFGVVYFSAYNKPGKYTEEQLKNDMDFSRKAIKFVNPIVAPFLVFFLLFKLLRFVCVRVIGPVIVRTYALTVNSKRAAGAVSASAGVVAGYFLDMPLGLATTVLCWLLIQALPKIREDLVLAH